MMKMNYKSSYGPLRLVDVLEQTAKDPHILPIKNDE